MRITRAIAAAVAIIVPITTACTGNRPSSSPTSASSSTASASTSTTSSASPNSFARDKAWIAYQTGTGTEGVWLIHPDGTDNHQIATDVRGEPGGELLPDWSPDGKRIVFTTRGGKTEPLYTYDLATKRSTQLFACKAPCAGDDEPVYSPDGSKVAFIRALTPFVTNADGDEVPSDCGLWIGDVRTGKVTQITSNTHPPCDRENNARWSPDGSQLTYWRDPHKDGQPTGTAVFVINADGTHEERLTDPKMFDGEADWSPDGKWIVFDSYPLAEFNFEPKISNLYRMHPDGSGTQQLTHYDTADLRATQPRYTPDGKWIIFTSVTSSTRSLWAIPAAGGEPIVIAPGGIYTHGTWQP